MISSSSILRVFFIAAAAHSSTSAPTPTDPESNFNRYYAAWKGLANDYGPVRDLYAPGAYHKLCWGGDKPDCVEGDVDEVILPFHQALKSFHGKVQIMGKANVGSPQVLVTRYANFMESKLGCGEVTTGLATIEYNDDGKIVRHLSLFDDAPVCVPEYHEAMSSTSSNVD